MISLFGAYFFWHYTTAFKDLWIHLKNFLWFFYHFFSLPVLARTFFDPWKRMEERYPRGLNVGGYASTFIINSMMRTIGAFMRTILLLFGGSVLLVVVCLGIACFFIWAILPGLALLVLISGARLLFI